MRIDRNLIIPGKLSYVLGEKPDVECILCSLRDRDKRVPQLVVLRDELMLVKKLLGQEKMNTNSETKGAGK